MSKLDDIDLMLESLYKLEKKITSFILGLGLITLLIARPFPVVANQTVPALFQQALKASKDGNFVEALKFVNQVGALAEKVNHHPAITFGYGYVRISLSTHDKKNITAKDLELAKLIDSI